jgi:hypothetical protein
MRRQVHLAHTARPQHPQDGVPGKHLTNPKRHAQIVRVQARRHLLFAPEGITDGASKTTERRHGTRF